MITKIFKLLLITFFFQPQQLFTQKIIVSTFGENFSGRSIYIYSVENDEKKAIYSTDHGYVFTDNNIKLSPANNLIAAIARSVDFIHNDANEIDYIDHKLFLISLKGVLVRTIPNVQRYAWSSDGKNLVCILGKDIEGFGFKADSLIVINTTNWEKNIINSKVSYQDVTWAKFDSLIYATDYINVYKIDNRSGTIKETPLKGIYFSSDGKYYYKPNYEGSGFQLFEALSNEEVTPTTINKEVVNFYQWFDKNELVIGDITHEKKIIDVSTGEVKKTFSGNMIGYDARTSEIIVYKDKKVFKDLSESKIEKIRY